MPKDCLEAVVKSLQKALESDAWQELKQIADDLGYIGTGIKVLRTINEAHFVKKVRVFGETANRLGFDAVAYKKLENKYGKEEVLEKLVVAIDRLSSTEKTEVLAYLMQALQAGRLNWGEFNSLSFSLEQINPAALAAEIEFSMGDWGELNSSATPFLIATGLAFSYTEDQPLTYGGSTGGTKYSATPLGKKFIDFGLKPYQESLKVNA